MYTCRHECMYISVYVCIYARMYAYIKIKKIKSKIFYSHKTVTLMNMDNSNTVICKNKTTQKGESVACRGCWMPGANEVLGCPRKYFLFVSQTFLMTFFSR